MKKLIKLYSIALIAIFSSSCSDFLNLGPVDQIADNVFWTDEATVKAYVNGLYTTFNFPNPSWNYDVNEVGLSQHLEIDTWSDDIHALAFGLGEVGKGTIQKEYWVKGGYTFGRIRQVNIAIENIQKFATTLDQNKKNTYIAEAKFIRAYIYFQKVRYFGGFPIVDKVLTLEDDLLLKRNTEAECITFILKDLNDAVASLPEKWSGADWGHASKAAALALRCRVELHAGLYDDCIKTCEAIMALGYNLETEYADLFNNPFTYKTSVETIFAMQCKFPGNGNNFQLMLSPNIQNTDIKGWTALWPTQSLVDDYYIQDSDGKAKQWVTSNNFINSFPSKGVAAMYENRDKRFYASIAYNGFEFVYKNGDNISKTKANLYCQATATEKPYSWMAEDASNDTHTSMTGYAVRKFMYVGEEYPLPNFGQVGDQENHYIYLRFGEVLLNYAEALLAKNRAGDATTQLNKLRKRAGLGNYSTNVTWADYERERRVELAFEGQRYFDMIRWAKAGKHNASIPEFNQKMKMIRIKGSAAKSYEIVDVTHRASEAQRNFETPKRYYFPIPFQETVKNPNLEQNPGWN